MSLDIKSIFEKVKTKKYLLFGILFLLMILVMSLKVLFPPQIYVLGETSSKEEAEVVEGNKASKKSQKIVIYVSGGVSVSGVVELENGDRLINAVEKLGGLTQDADLNRVNLAQKVEDGNHYIIPRINESIEVESSSDKLQNQVMSQNLESESDGKIDINKATVEDVDKISGIGPVLAKRIIEKRDELGGFKTIEELKEVEGIGEKKFSNIKNEVIIK